MKNLKHLNEEGEQVYSEAHAKELLAVQAWYNKTIQQLNDQLAKKRSDISVKYMKIAQQQAAQTATQTAAKTTANATSPGTAKTGTTVNSAGQEVNAQGNVKTQESYSNILKVKEVINEESFDTEDADSETVQDLKDYMDAENISYIEDEDETTLDFDKDELDPEWKKELKDIGLETDDDVNTDDILDYTDDEESVLDNEEKIDEKKVFYVKINDDQGDFTCKIYKLFDDGEWRGKIVEGDSDTFEKLSYDPDFDIYDIIAFLRENYDDAELIDEDEFNDSVEDPEEEPNEEVEESFGNNEDSHKIETFEQFLNEKLRFSDGEEFDTEGSLRVEKRKDGWYILGEGKLIPVNSKEEGINQINLMKK